MGNDPAEGLKYRGLKRGDKINHPRLGVCTFYKHDLLRQRLEVFDQYGLMKYITEKEIYECPRLRNSAS